MIGERERPTSGVLAKHMRPVRFGDLCIKVGLQPVDRAGDLLAERHPVELIQDGAMEALADSICLRALGLGAAVIDVLDGKSAMDEVSGGAGYGFSLDS